MEKSVEQVSRAIAVKRLKKMLDELPRVSGTRGESTTDFLRIQRMNWDGRSLDCLEGLTPPRP
ncbi:MULTISPECIES: hypothetical protein [unclassified Mesorhizobium]|uniref:hypothetical protein n=1 Tax=unclassified Mesorhizobium TaxID=325217 RepID=UPI00112A0F13|nr:MULTISPECIES: hypothetical protein [unclassified Mesorhizobium]TPK99884.1 hypothetical protein FJ567_15670 [Mesorhizobium sp. B2-4-16]TPL65229.1 hypothetical protein FJ956_21095 [Mesorhizobium sp. B2-4-3]